MHAPGADAAFGTVNNIALGNGGHVAFVAGLGEPLAGHGGIWSYKNGELVPIALTTSQFPGNSVIFPEFQLSLPRPLINRTGSIVFAARANPRYSVWSDRGNGLTLEARDGLPAAGMGGASTYGGVTSPAINDSGALAFSGYARGVGVGIWRDKGAGYEPVVYAGYSAPGIPDAIFSQPLHFSLNKHGNIAFVASLASGSGVTSANAAGIWIESDDALTLQVRKGDIALGIASDVVFSAFTQVLLNQSGDVAFRALLKGEEISTANDASIWTVLDGNLKLIAREGEQAPDAPIGIHFSKVASHLFNGSGQVAFRASLSDGTSHSLWATDRLGALRLIARQGDSLDVDPGPGADLRHVAELHLGNNPDTLDQSTGAESGWPTAFNNAGELAFIARFTDGTSGAFVSSLVAIPEPSSSALGALWGAMSLVIGRRRRNSRD